MYYSPEIVDEVRSRSDIVSVISSYVKLTRKGGGYFGCCPFHNEKTPSFHVHPGRQTYHCFGCGAGGNVITFLMEYENYSFPEALKALAERAGIELPEAEPDAAEKKRIGIRQMLLDIHREAATFYAKELYSKEGTIGRNYFAGRGLSRDTMLRFGLGYAPQSADILYRYLKAKGYNDEILSQSGLVKISEKRTFDRFWNRVIFPIMDGGRKVIGFGGRVMGEGEPKYLNSPETMIFDKSRNLYGLHLARRSRAGYFLLCEGYMDVIAMHQAGFDQAVASLGTAFTEGHAALIARYVKVVVLAYDSDEAGVKAAMRAIPMLKAAGIGVRVLDLNPYKDPDEFIKARGADAFTERISQAVNGFLFQSDVIRRGFDLRDPAQKTAFYRQIAGKLTEFPEELERENYLAAVAARHDIPVNGLRDMVRRAGERLPERPAGEDVLQVRANGNAGRMPRSRKVKGLLAAEIQVLAYGFVGDEASAWLMKELAPEEFPDEGIRAVAEDLWLLWKNGASPQPASLIDRFQEDDLKRNAAAEIAAAEFPEDMPLPDFKRLMKDNVRRIKKNHVDTMLKNPQDQGAFQDALTAAAALERAGTISDPPDLMPQGDLP